MTKEQAIKELESLNKTHDCESGHSRADEILLELINDPEVKAAFDNVDKWYA